jgi:hypothetical protein
VSRPARLRARLAGTVAATLLLTGGVVAATSGTAYADDCDGWWTLDGNRYNVKCAWLDNPYLQFRAVVFCTKITNGSTTIRYGAWEFTPSDTSRATCPSGYEGWVGSYEERRYP